MLLSSFFIFGLSLLFFIGQTRAQETVALPDLTVESLTVGPNSLTYTFRNIGTAPYNGMVDRVTAWLDTAGTVVASSNSILNLNLPVDGTLNLTVWSVNYPAAPASATRLRVSFTARNQEKNTGNNSIEAARPLPDFVIESPVLTWNSGSYTIRNLGPAGFYGRFNRRYEWLDVAGGVLSSSESSLPASTLGINTPLVFSLPTATFNAIPDGAVKLRITIDANSEIAEQSETNNVVELDRILPALDLRVYIASLAPTQLRFTLINIGDTSFNQTVNVSLTWQDANGTELGTSSVTEDVTLNPGYSGGDTFTIENDFIAHPPAGADRLRVVVDSDNHFVETDETNNYLTPIRNLPDFELQNFGMDRSSFYYRIANNGTAEFVGSITMHLTWLDGNGAALTTTDLTHAVNLGDRGTGTRHLTPQQYEASSFVLSPPNGAARLRAVINPDQTIAESSFTNNTIEVVPSYPDFTLENIILSENALTLSVRNGSNQGSTARYTAVLPLAFSWLDSAGTIIQTVNQSISVDLRTNASTPISTSNSSVVHPPRNGVRLRATVNPAGEINESNTSNNSVEVARTIFPDLTVENAFINADDETAHFTVRNVGTQNSTGEVTIKYAWLNEAGTEISSNEVAPNVSLTPGQSTTLIGESRYIVEPPANARQLLIEINPLHAAGLAETNYENNAVRVDRPLPDITIISATANQNNLTFIVANNGTTRYDHNTTRRLAWLDSNGAEISTHAVSGPIRVNPGERQTVTVVRTASDRYSTDPPAGGVRLRITLNANQAYPERTFENNSFEVSPSYPDLAIASGVLSASGASLTINNTGLASYSGPIRYQLEWLNADRNSVLAPSPVLTTPSTTIAAGGTMTFSNAGYALAVGANRAFLRVTINPDSTSVEGNYTNNSFDIPKPLPDLIVQITRLTDTSVDYRVTNSGQWQIAENISLTFEWVDDSGFSVGTQTQSYRVDLATGSSRDGSYIGPFITAPVATAFALRAVINPTRTALEENYDNNVSTEVPRAKPDLSIESASLTTSTLVYSVFNRGTRGLSALVGTSYEWVDDNGAALGARTGQRSTALEVGTSYQVNSASFSTGLQNFIRTPAAVGARLRVRLDYLNNIAELHENNNSITLTTVSDSATGEDLAAADENEVVGQVAAAAEGDNGQSTTPPGPEQSGSDSSTPQTSDGTSDERTHVPEIRNIPHAQVVRPRVLPGNPLYFFKNLGHEINAALTFDDTRRANLRLRYANETLLEAHFLATDGNLEAAASHLQTYQHDLNQAQTAINEVARAEASAPTTTLHTSAQLSARLAGNQINHQVILSAFERQATAANQPAALASVRQVRKTTLEHTAAVLSTLPERLAETTVNQALNQNGTPLRSFRNLEVLQALTESTLAKNRPVLERVVAAHEDRLIRSLEVTSSSLSSQLRGYASASGGENILYLKASDSLSAKAQNQTVRQNFEAVKGATLERIGATIKTAEAAGVGAVAKEGLFEHLKDGQIEDLRAIEALKNTLGERIAPVANDIKQTALQNAARFGRKEDFAKYHDAEQIKIISEVQTVAKALEQQGVANVVPEKMFATTTSPALKKEDIKQIEPTKNSEVEKIAQPVAPKIIKPTLIPEIKLPSKELSPAIPTVIPAPKVEPIIPVIKEVPMVKEAPPVVEKIPAVVEPIKIPIVTTPTNEPTPTTVEPVEKTILPSAPAPTSIIVPVVKEVVPTPVTVPAPTTKEVSPAPAPTPITAPTPVETKVTAPTPVETKVIVAPTDVPAPTSPTAVAMSIKDMAFSPASITVAVGGQITIQNFDKVTHALAGSLTSGDIKSGGSTTVRAPLKAGTYSFFCPYHSTMKATVIVK